MKAPGRATPLPSRPPDLEVFPVLDRAWPAHGVGSVAVLIAQLPDPSELTPGALVMVRESQKPARGLRRIARAVGSLVRKPPKAHAAVRSTALLARGYREIAARADPKTGEELVWGLVPTSGRSSSAP
jgi:hypothetical protein